MNKHLTQITLELWSNIIDDSHDEAKFPHKLILTYVLT